MIVDPDSIGPDSIDQAFAEQALAACNVNALRLALFHQTRDPRLSAMVVNQVPAQPPEMNTTGRSSYYVNKHGRSGVNMPWTQHEYYEMIRVPDPEELHDQLTLSALTLAGT